MNGEKDALQKRITAWGTELFGPIYLTNEVERCRRFLEEAVELVQAVGALTDQEVRDVVGYVLARPPGEAAQEVAGTLLTLAALSESLGVDMMAATEKELADLETPERKTKVLQRQREKNAAGVGCAAPVRGAPITIRWNQ